MQSLLLIVIIGVIMARLGLASNFTNAIDSKTLLPKDFSYSSNQLQSHIDYFKNLFTTRRDPDNSKLMEWLNSNPQGQLITLQSLVSDFNNITENASAKHDTVGLVASQIDTVTLLVTETQIQLQTQTHTQIHAQTITETFDRIQTLTEIVVEPTTIISKVKKPSANAASHKNHYLEIANSVPAKNVLNTQGPSYNVFVSPQLRDHSKHGSTLENKYSKPKTAPTFLRQKLVTNKEVHGNQNEKFKNNTGMAIVNSSVIDIMPNYQLVVLHVSLPTDIIHKGSAVIYTQTSSNNSEFFSASTIHSIVSNARTTTTSDNPTKPLESMLTIAKTRKLKLAHSIPTFIQSPDDVTGATRNKYKPHRKNNTKPEFNLFGFASKGTQNHENLCSVFAAIFLVSAVLIL